MKHFIETVKEKPWYVTLGFVTFIVLLTSTLAFFIMQEPRILLLMFGAVLMFWAINMFAQFMTYWDRRRKALMMSEVPEYQKSMHRVIEPSRYKHDGNFNK